MNYKFNKSFTADNKAGYTMNIENQKDLDDCIGYMSEKTVTDLIKKKCIKLIPTPRIETHTLRKQRDPFDDAICRLDGMMMECNHFMYVNILCIIERPVWDTTKSEPEAHVRRHKDLAICREFKVQMTNLFGSFDENGFFLKEDLWLALEVAQDEVRARL